MVDAVPWGESVQEHLFRNIVDHSLSATYRSNGWWNDRTVDEVVVGRAVADPQGIAYRTSEGSLSWAQLDASVDTVASSLVAVGIEPGERVAVCMSDTPALHIAFLALERIGATIVGMGAKAGRREQHYLLNRTGATTLLTRAGADADEAIGELRAELGGLRHIALGGPALGDATRVIVDGVDATASPLGAAAFAQRRMGPDDLFLINSTSGTTGLPKCVVHTQNRWWYFHQCAERNGALDDNDVFLAAVPAPFGFGLWTSHITPLHLGCATVLLDRFSAAAAFEAIERHQVTVLACVSTQFLMMLASPEAENYDLSSLRVMFTGGEAVPYDKARDFERLTGCTTLQFYGSNETGLLSGTTLGDTPEARLRTAGRVDPNMQVRLYDNGTEVPLPGRGQPACRGPAMSQGYLDDPEANAALYTEDGWMFMGDICEIDADGFLTVVGRTSDFIIRGGKNISAPQVEADVMTHPAVAHAAAVAMPDPVFGERVCVYVELVDGAPVPTLDDVCTHLSKVGASRELFPERLIVLDELPRSSGAKVAKGDLRTDIRRRVELEAATHGEV
ncbi:MAG: acyl--CoA ligase [Actinobacteria bacterium]|nr:acyl--CoA ligase [Actinomycetota bacterium]